MPDSRAAARMRLMRDHHIWSRSGPTETCSTGTPANLLHPADVRLRRGRQVLPNRAVEMSSCQPGWASYKAPSRPGPSTPAANPPAPAPVPVGGADWNLRQTLWHIQLGEDDAGQSAECGGCSAEDTVQPAHPAGATVVVPYSSHGAIRHRAVVRRRACQFGGEGPAPTRVWNALLKPSTRPRADAQPQAPQRNGGGGGGTGTLGVGAVVQIEQGAWAASARTVRPSASAWCSSKRYP
jgi:hypothetical protein